MRSYASARALHCAEVDRWLAALVDTAPGVALVAVGGLGRHELAPYSDLDLLLLHTGGDEVEEVAEKVWYPIWDRGIGLDHSVRTLAESVRVARHDLKVALGLHYARHVAGDPALTAQLRRSALADWRAAASRRLPGLRAMGEERAARHGELAFLLEPDLKRARGGLRDVHAMQAISAAWVAAGPDARVRCAYELLLDVRHALHEVTGRHTDRLTLQEQDAVAHLLGLVDADALLRALAAAGRTVAYASDLAWRGANRFIESRGRPRRAPVRHPLAEGVVEQDGEVVLARDANPEGDAVLVLRAGAAAAQRGLPLAPATLDTLAARGAPLPAPWPTEARDALVALLGGGAAAVPVWEAFDQAGLIVTLLPEWERVRNRPQRNALHMFTVDRHLVETAARAAGFAREVARPDLLLLAAILHDIGKGWPGEHGRTGAVIASGVGGRVGLPPADVDVLARVVRLHLLLPRTATRRDLDDPVTVRSVADAVGSREVLELVSALATADGLATGHGAWNEWKAGLVADLVRRVDATLTGAPPPPPPELAAAQVELARGRGPAALVEGPRVTVVAPDRPGLMWRAAGVLDLHRLVVRSATAASYGDTAVTVFTAVPRFGTPPDASLLSSDLRRALSGRLDVAARLERRRQTYRTPSGVPVPPPRVALVDDASHTATVVEVRAHDRPGLLWAVGHALGQCGLDIRAARVETLGAEAVDVFYVVGGDGRPLADRFHRAVVRQTVLDAAR